jgi:hypothetical protein
MACRKQHAAGHLSEATMLTLHSRVHMGREMRVWTKDMADVGQFEIIERADLETFNDMLKQFRLGQIIVHHDDCDGYTSDCDCPRM